MLFFSLILFSMLDFSEIVTKCWNWIFCKTNVPLVVGIHIVNISIKKPLEFWGSFTTLILDLSLSTCKWLLSLWDITVWKWIDLFQNRILYCEFLCPRISHINDFVFIFCIWISVLRGKKQFENATLGCRDIKKTKKI